MNRIQKGYYISIFLISFLFLPVISFIIKDDLLVVNPKTNLKISSFSNEDVNYLIITIENFKEAMEPLAIWKTQKGLISKIVTIEDIELEYLGKDTEEKVKNCIIDYYEKNNTQWVLLAGDNEDVPSRYVNASEWYTDDGDFVSCDSYYTDLNNDWDLNDDYVWASIGDNYDYQAEVYVGRLSANMKTEMDYLVQKILDYEKNPPVGSWMTNALYAGAFINFAEDWNDDGNADILEGDRNRVGNFLASNLPTNWSYTTLGETQGIRPTSHPYNASLTMGNLENSINDGLGIGTIFAHGNPTALYRMIWLDDYDHDGLFDYNASHYSGGVAIDYAVYPELLNIPISNIQAQNKKLGIYYLLGCSNGRFDVAEDCLTEFFLKTAAIGCIGGSYVVWGEDNWTERAHGGWYAEGLCSRFFEYLFQYNHPGQALALAKEDYINDRIDSGMDAVEPLWENKTLKQFNLFGDPEVPIWLNIPKQLDLERLSTENESETSSQFKVSVNNDTIENATITITNGIELIWIGKTNNIGIVEVPYPWNEISKYTITATKLGFVPDQITSDTQQKINGFIVPILLIICFFSVCIILLRLPNTNLELNNRKSH